MGIAVLGLGVPRTGATEESYLHRQRSAKSANRDSRIHERRTVEAAHCRDSGRSGHDDDDNDHDRGGLDSHHDDRGSGQDRGDRAATRHDDRNRSHDDHGLDDDGHDHQPAETTDGLLQIINIAVAKTAFLRVDRSGRVIAAATNTGCMPRRGAEVFLLHLGGQIEPSPNFDVTSCRWLGDFTAAGRFQPQDCDAKRPTDD